MIIGGSAAGINAVEGIREADKDGAITLVSDESFPLYSRCLLSYYVAGKLPKEKLKYRNDDFFAKHKVKALLGARVEKVIPASKKVALSNGDSLAYDRLLIASGASAKLENIPGFDKKGVNKLRTINDAEEIIRVSERAKTVAVLGGGLVGLKNAYALRERKLDIVVIVKSKQLLSQMLDKDGADIVQRHLESKGIKVMLGVEAKEILGGGEVSGITLDNGEKLDCQLVVFGKGVNTNIGLVEGTAVKTHWGITVNEKLQTNIPEIYAAGDVAETMDLATGLPGINAIWPCAVEQGRIAGLNMAGRQEKYLGSFGMNSVDFYGLSIISAGITKPKDDGFEILIKQNNEKKLYRKVVLRNNRIAGIVLVNDVDRAGVYAALLKKKIDITSIKDLLIRDNFDFAKVVPLIKEQKYNFQEEEYQDILTSPKI